MDRPAGPLKGIVWVVALVLCVAAGACGGARHSLWAPSPQRAEGLPATADALLSLSDAQIGQRPRSADQVDRALAALEAIEAQGGEPSFGLHWRLARACFLMTEFVPMDGVGDAFVARGVTHGERAVELASSRVEGHYYLALNMVKAVEVSAEVDRLAPMLEVAKRAVAIDAAFDEAGPLRLVGKVYMVAPEWPTSVGDRDEAVEVLKKAVSIAATAMNRLFLGQAFYHVEDFDHAIPHIRRAVKAGQGAGLEARWMDEARDYLLRMGVFE